MESTSFTPPSIEVLNQLLPAYHFIDFIAQGGMGAVYLAKQVSLDREVAIKILPRELSADPEFCASFKTEARAMARLNHPNLIGIYDSGEVDGMLYISMEYVPGKSLYHSSWNKKIDPAEASRIIVAICEGLSHAHENGIIHRDIKPANILLTPKVEPKIGDFGLAQAIGVTHDGIVMGTPGYSAPEVISHPEKADRRSDIFAVGVILHELLTGQKPEPGITAASLCQCKPEFDQIISRATHPNPLMRYPDAKSMATAILDLLNSNGAAKAKSNSVGPAVIRKPQAVVGSVMMPGVAAPRSHDTAKRPPHPTTVIKPRHTGMSHVRNLLIMAGLCVVLFFAYKKLMATLKDADKKEQASQNREKEEQSRLQRETEKNIARLQTDPSRKPKDNSTQQNDDRSEDTNESALDSLDRLQNDLSKGSREEMPRGTTRRGELDFFLVKDAMTWDDAVLFAEEHGGHIALPTNQDDISFFRSLLKNNETIWLGAGLSGRDRWVLLDGSPWSLGATPPGTGNIATLSHLGNLRAAEPTRTMTFVIAWHRDGSNPCSLENQLKVARKSLDAPTPIFPPGTLASGSRYYLPILREMDQSEALSLARQAGAHIAALSNREESFWVIANLGKFNADDGIWLGGEKTGGVWKWSTNEPWTYALWAPDSPEDDDDANSLVYLPGKGWHNMASSEVADGVLLEWSKDAAATNTPSTNPSSAAPDVAGLITKCRTAVLSNAKDRDDKLAANLKAFQWDLDVWLRGLNPIDKADWQESIAVIKSLADDGQVPSVEDVAEVLRDNDGGIPAMHAGIVKIHNFAFNKQNEIRTEHVMRNEKIRNAYVLKIKEMGSAAQKAGQTDLVRQMKDYLDDASDLDSWIDSMLED